MKARSYPQRSYPEVLCVIMQHVVGPWQIPWQVKKKHTRQTGLNCEVLLQKGKEECEGRGGEGAIKREFGREGGRKESRERETGKFLSVPS